MPFLSPRLRLALSAAVLLPVAAAGAQDAPWITRPEPMGAKARTLAEEAVRAASADAATRVVAEILRLPPGQAVAVLEAVLSGDTVPVAAKEAVLTALAEDPACPVSRRLAGAVLRLANAAPRPADAAPLPAARNVWTRSELWQRAMRRMNSPEVVKKLVEWARDTTLPFEQRGAAVRALGGLPSPAGLQFLLDARAGKADDGLRGDVNSALMEMFCLSVPPTAAQLAQWRQLAAKQDSSAINRYLKEVLLDRDAASQAEKAKLIRRVVMLEEDAYAKASSDEGQPAILARMLADDLAEVRLKGLELVSARIEVNRPVSPAVRGAMRACLAHPLPLVRARSVSQLQTLGDEEGAKATAARLAAGTEDNSEVLAAMARMMRRQPDATALPAVRRLLEHPSVAVEAALALVAYDEKKLLDAAAKPDLAQFLKAQLGPGVAAPDSPLAESHLLLLGRVLDPADAQGWALVAAWLADAKAQPAAREAAALVLEKSTQPLAPLLAVPGGADAKLADKLAEIAFRAVGARGVSRADIEPLVAHVPAPGALRDLWADALIGWSGRAAPEEVASAARAVVKNGAPRNLAVRMAGKALSAKDLAEGKQAMLLACRAEMSEENGDLAAAQEDYDNAFAALAGPARHGVFAKRVQLRLAQGKWADAAAVCAKEASKGAEYPAMLKEPLAQTLAAMEKEVAKDASSQAAAVVALKELRQALGARPAAAEGLAAVNALLGKWAPPEPVPEPKTEPKAEPKAEPKIEPKPETKPEAKPEAPAKPEAKPPGKP